MRKPLEIQTEIDLLRIAIRKNYRIIAELDKELAASLELLKAAKG